ncbi:MAG: transposase [Halomonas sp.]|nr:transposase [Halomonas sp.]
MIERWIRYYNEQRPHQSLGYVAPRAHLALSG